MFSRKFDKGVKTGAAVLGAIVTVLFLVGYFGFRNSFADVGYRPEQPVPFSHKLHAGELQIHCQYCHAGVEKSGHSPVPTTQTCMNCHTAVKAESPKLQLVRDSYESGKPIQWARIHKVPDYVHFNHSRHIRAQIDCKSCHGPVEEMGVVSQYKPLAMGWCLDCHRSPEKFIVGARPISGIFTGERKDLNQLLDTTSRYVFEPIAAQVGTSTPITAPQYGGYDSEVPNTSKVIRTKLGTIPHPKKAGIGPENCSACHY